MAHVRTLEIGLHFNTSYCTEKFSLRPWAPNQGNFITQVSQESRLPRSINSHYSTVEQVEYIFTCKYL